MMKLLLLLAIIALALAVARRDPPTAPESAPGTAAASSDDHHVSPDPGSDRKITYVRGLRRYVEHNARVAPLQSIGGGSGSRSPRSALPAANTSDQTIREQWGWQPQGSSLDRRPARGR